MTRTESDVQMNINKLTKLDGVRVLLVDDSADNRILIENILGRKGVVVESAQDGREGVDKALSKEFDLILMDIQMPILDGLQATKELRQKGYVKPIIALTAHAMIEERQKTHAAGCNAHLTKPIEIANYLILFLRIFSRTHLINKNHMALDI